MNAVYVTEQRITKIGRPSGLDDQNQFALSVIGFDKNFDFFAMVRADMAMLRDMPGIIDATPINQIPLSGGGSSTKYLFAAQKKGESSPVAYYGTDDHAVKALGVKLADGRNFGASDVDYRPKDVQGIPGHGRGDACICRRRCFPSRPTSSWARPFMTITASPWSSPGVIEQMHGALVGLDKVDRVMLTPVVGPGPGLAYLVRTEPGKLDSRHGRRRRSHCASEIRIAWWASCARCRISNKAATLAIR